MFNFSINIDPVHVTFCQFVWGQVMIWMFKSAPKSCVYLCSLCFIPILGMRTTLVIIGFDRVKIKPKIEKSIIASVTRRKLPNVYKICPKMISLEKW